MTELQLYKLEEGSQLSTAFSSLNPFEDELMVLKHLPFFTLATVVDTK